MTPEQRKAYRIAIDFHASHAGGDILQAAQDMATTASAHGNDPFLNDLLIAVYNQLVREGRL